MTAHFSWDSRSLASVVCRDFEVTRRLDGEVLSREYPVAGAFRLFAGPERLRADPEFPPREFRIQVDLTDKSWAEVRAAIQEQDDVTKCGLGLDPDELLAKIRERLHEGFDVKLPRSLFRPVDFPAAVRQDVTIEDRRVDLAVADPRAGHDAGGGVVRGRRSHAHRSRSRGHAERGSLAGQVTAAHASECD